MFGLFKKTETVKRIKKVWSFETQYTLISTNDKYNIRYYTFKDNKNGIELKVGLSSKGSLVTCGLSEDFSIKLLSLIRGI